jgi:hypothetical protein
MAEPTADQIPDLIRPEADTIKMPEPEGLFMIERIVPAFLQASRAFAEGRPEAETLIEVLVGNLRENARDAGEAGAKGEGVWTAAAELFRAVFTERQEAVTLVEATKALDANPGYAWKTLCALYYLGASTDRHVLPALAVNLHMAVAEFICRGTMHMPEVYEKIVADWFSAYWRRTFEHARFRFFAPRLVDLDLRSAAKSDISIRVQRTLRAAADGLAMPLPERGREWFDYKPASIG